MSERENAIEQLQRDLRAMIRGVELILGIDAAYPITIHLLEAYEATKRCSQCAA